MNGICQILIRYEMLLPVRKTVGFFVANMIKLYVTFLMSYARPSGTSWQ